MFFALVQEWFRWIRLRQAGHRAAGRFVAKVEKGDEREVERNKSESEGKRRRARGMEEG